MQVVQEQRRQMAAAGRGGCRFTVAGWWVQCAGMCRSCCLIDKVSMKVVNGVTTGKRFTKGDIVNQKLDHRQAQATQGFAEDL